MNYSKEEIINALTVIKDVCATTTCDNCPFYIGLCLVNSDNPCVWDIATTEPPTWKAFLSD